MYRSLRNAVFCIAGMTALFVATGPVRACSVPGAPARQITSGMPAGLAAMLQPTDSAAPKPDANRAPSIIGLWKVDFIADGQVVDQGFDAYHSDGTEILIDERAPATDNVCLGVWDHSGPLTIKLKHPSWYFDLNGNLLGIVVIHETVKLDPDGDRFSGKSIADVYDLNGNKLSSSEAELKGTRIKPD